MIYEWILCVYVHVCVDVRVFTCVCAVAQINVSCPAEDCEDMQNVCVSVCVCVTACVCTR